MRSTNCCLVVLAVVVLLAACFLCFLNDAEAAATTQQFHRIKRNVPTQTTTKQQPPINNRPIIGVLTQPVGTGEYSHFGGNAYLVASYVKFLESAGARVVPVFYDGGVEYLQQIMGSINGLLFTGGEQNLTRGNPFFDAAEYIFATALHFNSNGDYFPLWGTCQGFQLLNVLASGTGSSDLVLSAFDAWDISMPLNFTPASKTSRLFGNAPQSIVQTLATEAVTMNWHHWGVSPAIFNSIPELKSFYNVLSTNVDREGKEFISTVEAKNYPFYATQWHPEWPIFEWESTSNVSHTYDAILANRYAANFFVNECRRSQHKFPTAELESATLIYNYKPTYTEPVTGDEQCYFFPQK